MAKRIERDSLGEVEVDQDRLWGAQTERSRLNFRIGEERMPLAIVHNLALIKEAAATVNREKGRVPADVADAIIEAAREIVAGRWDDEFPLSVWQTGSGTQTNMNVNEVIANLAMRLHPGLHVHPNDHVNRGQSSNDVFPSALHMAILRACEMELLPAVEHLAATIRVVAAKNEAVVKIGRTHLQDATPLTLGQEIGAWASMLETNHRMILDTIEYLRPLALGGTAVGTGLNTTADFGEACTAVLSDRCGTLFTSEPDKFRALASRDSVAFVHGALDTLAANLKKIAEDVRMLASGPRSGIGEIIIPSNEPGSSIMPGKINPTQSEAVTMVTARVLGNQTTVSVAASQGQYQLNVYLPLLGHTVLQSIRLLADASRNFADKCVAGIEPNQTRIAENLDRSLMLVTALSPHIGYDKASEIAKVALADDLTLEEAGVRLGYLTAEEYRRWVKAEDMVFPER